VTEETKESTRIAELEWKRGTRGDGLSNFKAAPSVNLRPSASGLDLVVRYVTRASERSDTRDRLYSLIINQPDQSSTSEPAGT
jgi:hypothetical protein